MSNSFLRFTPTEVIDFFRRMTKEAVTYREQNSVMRNDFLQLLINLKQKAEDVNNSKDKSIPWYKSKYHTGGEPMCWPLFVAESTPSAGCGYTESGRSKVTNGSNILSAFIWC